MLFYSHRQNKIYYCIILTVNLLTWRKESPVFFTEKQNHLFSLMTFNPEVLKGANGYEKFTNNSFINIFSLQSLGYRRNPI